MRGAVSRRRSGREGYALLALLAAAAILLAGLALSLPRLAMQSQRVKDERLIERGEEYMRAIKHYYRKHGKYPRDLDDLEETDGVRYLRRRFADPMSVSGEWRLIHMGTDGRFEDSLIYDRGRRRPVLDGGLLGAPEGDRDPGNPDATGSPLTAPTNPFAPDSGQFVDPRMPPEPEPLGGPGRARVARQSAAPDLATRGRYNQGFEFDSAEPADAETSDGNSEDGRLGYGGILPGPAPMVDFDPRRLNPGESPGRIPPSAAPPGPVRGFPGGPPGFGSRPGSRRQGTGGANPPGVAGPLGQRAGQGAAGLINQILTNPRAGGLSGGAAGQAIARSGPVFERGIAGVASTSEEVGVKVYKSKESYAEWEFVYDYRKDAKTEGGAQPATSPMRSTQSPRAGPPLGGLTRR